MLSALSVLRWGSRKPVEQVQAASETPEQWEDEVHPWLAGADQWSERYGTLLAQARLWRLQALAAWFVALVGVSGAVALAIILVNHKSDLYVVEVDKHQYVIPVKQAERGQVPEVKYRIEAVSQWLLAFRTVVDSVDAQHFLVDQAYARMAKDTAAWRQANQWYAATNPMLTSKRVVKVEITRAFSMNDLTHMTIEWVERERATSGHPKESRFSAYVTLAYSPTRLLEDIEVNAAGIYIADYSITELGKTK